MAMLVNNCFVTPALGFLEGYFLTKYEYFAEN